MILSVTLNPAVDNALFLPCLRVGDTNRVSRVDRDAGGKGLNQSRVIAALGGQTLATGFLGGPEGTFIRQVLDGESIDHRFVSIAGSTRANFSVEDDLGGAPTTFNLPGPTIAATEWEELLALCDQLAPTAAWASLAGSIPRGVASDAYRTLGALLRSHGVRVMLDADDEPMKLGLEAKPTFIKPNQHEAARYLGRPVETLEQAAQAASDLRSCCVEDGFVVLSRGADGAVLASTDGIWAGGSPPVQVRSTMGSGDSMIAGILWALESGKPLPEAFAWGLAAGAATAATDGTKIASREAIESLVCGATIDRLC